jgi:hypothetical protein
MPRGPHPDKPKRRPPAGNPAAGHPGWLRLDNSAKIWPAILSPRYTTLFRLSACLDHPVRLACLERALADTMARFPYFNVQLRKGLFWYHMEYLPAQPPVEADSVNPCMRAELIGHGHWPFRVRAFNRRISVEFSHMMTDGTGALTFLRVLVTRYFECIGVACSGLPGLPRVGETPDPREWEDSYPLVVVDSPASLPRIRAEAPAFRLPGQLVPAGTYRVISGLLPAGRVLSLAKAQGISITEYVGSALLYCLQDIQERHLAEGRGYLGLKELRPIRLNVPVNLRPLFDSPTMRNFFSFADPGIDPRLGKWTFAEICEQVHRHMRFQVQEKRMRLLISRNVRGETAVLNRLIPLFVKDLILQGVYSFLGDRRFSTSLSNLGRVEMPPELKDRLSHWVFIPPPSPVSKVNCTMLSWNDTLCISFGSMIGGNELEREFFRFFSGQGVPVYIESNAEWFESSGKGRS